MSRHNQRKTVVEPMKKKDRLRIAFTGAMLVCFGLGSLSRGRLLYANWWGGMVFAPFALAIGLMVLGIAVYGRMRKVK
jgi:fatty acid desaturase